MTDQNGVPFCFYVWYRTETNTVLSWNSCCNYGYSLPTPFGYVVFSAPCRQPSKAMLSAFCFAEYSCVFSLKAGPSEPGYNLNYLFDICFGATHGVPSGMEAWVFLSIYDGFSCPRFFTHIWRLFSWVLDFGKVKKVQQPPGNFLGIDCQICRPLSILLQRTGFW